MSSSLIILFFIWIVMGLGLGYYATSIFKGERPYGLNGDLIAALVTSIVVGLLVDSRGDFTRVRENAGTDIAILGGFDGPRIGRMPFKEIERACRDMLREFCQDPRIVPGTSALDVSLHTPRQSIHALRRAVAAAGTA